MFYVPGTFVRARVITAFAGKLCPAIAIQDTQLFLSVMEIYFSVPAIPDIRTRERCMMTAKTRG